jgi:hypothetical protein
VRRAQRLTPVVSIQNRYNVDEVLDGAVDEDVASFKLSMRNGAGRLSCAAAT